MAHHEWIDLLLLSVLLKVNQPNQTSSRLTHSEMS